jgi:hypothetical protein
MATAMSPANVLDLEEHCRHRVDRHLEELLGDDEEGALRARVVQEAVDAAFYDHVERVLALWQEPRWGGVA